MARYKGFKRKEFNEINSLSNSFLLYEDISNISNEDKNILTNNININAHHRSNINVIVTHTLLNSSIYMYIRLCALFLFISGTHSSNIHRILMESRLFTKEEVAKYVKEFARCSKKFQYWLFNGITKTFSKVTLDQLVDIIKQIISDNKQISERNNLDQEMGENIVEGRWEGEKVVEEEEEEDEAKVEKKVWLERAQKLLSSNNVNPETVQISLLIFDILLITFKDIIRHSDFTIPLCKTNGKVSSKCSKNIRNKSVIKHYSLLEYSTIVATKDMKMDKTMFRLHKFLSQHVVLPKFLIKNKRLLSYISNANK